MAVCRRRALHLREGRRPGGGPPRLRLLHGAGQLAGHDVEERRRWLVLSLDLQGRRGQLPRWREELQAPHPGQRARQGFLVRAGLRLAQPIRVEERPEVSLGEQVHRSKINADGSVDVYFGPEMPAGQEKNWIQDRPRARDGSRSSASTVRWSRSTTRRGC